MSGRTCPGECPDPYLSVRESGVNVGTLLSNGLKISGADNIWGRIP